MHNSPFLKNRFPGRVGKALLIILMLCCFAHCRHVPIDGNEIGLPVNLDEIEKQIKAFVPDPTYPDNPFILVTLKEALIGGRERNGGIGACLIREATGEIVERSHNRQYEPHFRSDLHAEMDLLNRYEERMRITRSRNPKDPTFRNPRNMTGLILYTSVEPCPMCLTRIINAGVKKVYYALPDDNGGMAQRFDNLPPFWRSMAQGIILEPARCSPELKEIAQKLFRPMFLQKGTVP
jgi:cytosine deaminase